MPEEPIDQDRFNATFRRLGDMMTAAHVAGLVALGLRVGLFEALAGAGALTSHELADRAGLHERWVREWLYAQAAGGVVDHAVDPAGLDRFRLSSEVAALLAEPASLFYLGNNFAALPNRLALVPALAGSFRTGLGLSYDERGPDAAEDTEAIFGNWYRQMLVPVALPQLDGTVDRLRAGAVVADVGCGAAVALSVMAASFPASEFHGYEVSDHALDRARRNLRELDPAVAERITLHRVPDEVLPDEPTFDLITTFDCLHDMTDPDAVTRAIRAAIKPAGVWFIADIACAPTFAEFVERRRQFAAMTYSVSVYACLSSAMSEPGGAGLGTCGLPEPAMRALTERAGFTRFRTLKLDHPVNAFYEARP